MNLSDFEYDLPKELIAQEALTNRGEARLLVLNRETGEIKHDRFYRLPDYFEPNEVLVLNNTKVLPARLFGKKETGGIVEVLLLKKVENPETNGNRSGEIWEALLKPSTRVKADQTISFENQKSNARFSARVMNTSQENAGIRRLEFNKGLDVASVMNQIGRIPLPPYIDREDLPIDRELYQTVFAQIPGSVASPTAGLHFDPDLLRKIEKKGIEIVYVTLHVGYGTFQPVSAEDVSKHQMHPEYFNIPEESAEKINMAKMDGRRIVACGTTSVRTLESAVSETVPPEVSAMRGSTNLFIFPPYEFKMTDAIITNFHLPRTTLLMLAAAFCGKENLRRAYEEAIRNRYRFYSYGDAMLIL